jgi:hypothetical protein
MHYHPNTNNLEKKTVKPSFTIQAYIKCAKCGKTFDRAIDSLDHFKEIVAKSGWERVDFVKSNENSVSGAKDIHGTCCPSCRKEIEVWEKGNPHSHKKVANISKVMTVFTAGEALLRQTEKDMKAAGHNVDIHDDLREFESKLPGLKTIEFTEPMKNHILNSQGGI